MSHLDETQRNLLEQSHSAYRALQQEALPLEREHAAADGDIVS